MSDLTPVEKFNKAVESKQNVKDEPEVTIWTGSYSAKAMYGSFLIGALVTVLGIVALVMISSLRTSWGIWTVVAVLLLMWAYLLGVMAYRKMSRSYELTNQRMKHRLGLFFRTANRVELIDISDVTFLQGPVEQILNVGKIRIKSTDVTDPNLELIGIADVKKIADMIDELRRKERHRRGLHVTNV
jgi:membrane protein YdbS with pleckstrin-like domain